jgi:CCR4-NOT transcription complex subunit 7/8
VDIVSQVSAEFDLVHFFHRRCSSGYDFGYFVKLLTAESLPTMEEAFFELLQTWFPSIYDIKYMMRAAKALKGGLQDVADELGVRSV